MAEVESPLAATLFPIELAGTRRPRAHLVCESATADLSPDLHEAIDQAIVFLRLCLSEQTTARVFRGRCEDELMRRIASDDASRGAVDGWVRALGVEPKGHVVCLVAQGPQGQRDAHAELREALVDMADALDMPRIAISGDEEAGIALVTGDRPEAAHTAIDRLRALLAGEGDDRSIAIGTSSVIASDISDITRAFIDAGQVCRLNQIVDERPRPEHEPESPLSAILLRGDDDARATLHAAVLAPLVTYDREHGSELVRTLDLFLSSNGQWAGSAALLDIHVNTLRYRLSRIEELTGRNLGSMADRVDFYVALRSLT